MTAPLLRNGTQIACDLRASSAICAPEILVPRTLADVLRMLAENPPRAFSMLRTTSSRLASYLDKPLDDISLDLIKDTRVGFKPFLERGKYARNSIRTYVNHVRILLNCAIDFGWDPQAKVIPEEWRGVLALSAEKQCADLATYLSSVRKTPREVTIEDVDHWAEMRVQQGLSHMRATSKKGWFWHLLSDAGCTEQTPLCLVREKHYRVPLAQFPPGLKKEVVGLLKWKQAKFSVGRPKGGRLREVTAKQLQDLICGLFGFVVNICGESEISSLPQLVQKETISAYLEWCINERKVKGYSLGCACRLLGAAMRQHPLYSSIDFAWFKSLIDSLPIEHDSDLKKRKASKCLDYKVVECIPVKIHAERATAAKKGARKLALLAKDELLMKWLIVLPWRQRNLRECRIVGSEPNLFKGKIPPFCDVDKPEWVLQEELKDPQAEFWQFHFNCDETKTKIDVHAVLPRPLIGLLEEYLRDFRPQLVQGADPGTLFVNQAGKPMTATQVVRQVSSLTQRHGGRRVPPHHFRDIFSFIWLKEHPKDFLTLAKILWHSNVNTTIRTYGSRFNESSGVCAAESWIEEREGNSK